MNSLSYPSFPATDLRSHGELMRAGSCTPFCFSVLSGSCIMVDSIYTQMTPPPLWPSPFSASAHVSWPWRAHKK